MVLDGELYHAKVKCCAVDRDGIPVGVKNSNPITDTGQYDVWYLDVVIKTLAANVIAENILYQFDKEGHQKLMIDEIIDHRSNSEEILHDDALYLTKKVDKCRKRTNKLWELYLQWKDGSYHWIEINDINKF